MAKNKLKEKLEALVKNLNTEVKSIQGDPGALGKKIAAEAKTAAADARKALGSEDD